MQNTIIKGTGNSRTLRTVPNALTLYPDTKSMLQAMIDGTFPIDIGPLNLSGLLQKGTDLNEETLLTDALCAALELPATATPTEAMEKIRSIATEAQNTANEKAKIFSGTYVGNNTAGSANRNSLTFPFTPKIVIISSSTSWLEFNVYVWGASVTNAVDNYHSNNVTRNGNTMSWYNSNNGMYSYQLNASTTYRYIAIG